MPSPEIALSLGTWGKNPNRQGIPCFLGSTPMNTIDDLQGADVAVLGVPFVSPLIGYENDVAPRMVRAAGQNYMGSYISDLDIDPAEVLRILDYGDVDFPFGDTPAAMAAVSQVVGQVVDAGCIPVTIGGNAPASSFAVAKAIAERASGKIGVINFDGHTDTAAEYGDEPNSSNWIRSAYLQLPALSASNHLQIGMRGMNNRREDMEFFREHGMRTIMSPEVHELGSQGLAAEAVRHASDGTDQIWFSVDMDVLDNSDTPDWDWPDPHGVHASDILATAYAAGGTGKLCGISLMMIGGSVYSVQRLAVWIILYGLAGVAAARVAANTK